MHLVISNKIFPLVSHGDTGRGQVMDIIHWVVCVDEKRALVEHTWFKVLLGGLDLHL